LILIAGIHKENIKRIMVESERNSEKTGMKTKDKILKAARILFAEKGFREVTVREIAARAGVNSALVG